MKRIVAGTLLLVVMLYGPAVAEIYKYVDESGNLRFTDDITQIPDDQRKKMSTYKEVVTDPVTAEAAQNKRDAEFEQLQKDRQTAESAAASNALKSRAAKLEKEQAALKEEADALTKERDKLGPPPSQAASKSRIRVYNSQVEAFNQKQSSHQKKAQSIEKELKILKDEAGSASLQLDLEQ